MFGIFLDTLGWMIDWGGYGSIAGAIVGAVSPIWVALIPDFLEDGAVCDTPWECDGLPACIMLVAAMGALMGSIIGGLLGLVGKKLASSVLGPDKEKAGEIVGGLIGGIAPGAMVKLLWF